jgi:Toprim domain
MTTALSLADIDALIGGNIGRFDVACPLCGPGCSSPRNQRRRVLRIWRMEPDFASFRCARCEGEGYAVDRTTERADPAVIEMARAKAQERRRIEAAESQRRARWFWSQRQPPIGSIVETYLRECRGYTGRLPATLGFLPARGEHPPAMAAAFGMAHETEPGILVIGNDDITGVHITKLMSDGSDKFGSDADKITIGIANTSPIMLAPPNDLLGLAIGEGIEDALSAHQATGLGAWAAGTAGRLPAMADSVPDYIESVTILVDADTNGEKNSTELARRLVARGIEVLMVRTGGLA